MDEKDTIIDLEVGEDGVYAPVGDPRSYMESEKPKEEPKPQTRRTLKQKPVVKMNHVQVISRDPRRICREDIDNFVEGFEEVFKLFGG